MVHGLTAIQSGATLGEVRHFVIFLLFASSTFSELPVSPVRAALAQTAGVTDAGRASLETLAAGIVADRRPDAKSALDSIDRRGLSTGEFGELSRAYVLLGFPEAAARAGNALPPNDPRRASGLSQAASAAANRSEYEHAVRLANEALRLNPRDPVATAVLRLAQGRGRSSVDVLPPPTRQVAPTPNPQPSSARPAIALSEPVRRRSLSDTSMPSLQMLDDETAAPEATLKDRAIAFITPSKQLVESDLRKMRALLVGFELPPETLSLASVNQSAPLNFAPWLRSVPDSKLAPIAYGVIDAGLLGEFRPGIGKGEITLNHFIRGSEPEVRATVLLHEIYHYWDKKVANNPYNETYGYPTPQAMADREYDAFMVAQRFWKHARPSGATSAAARALDRIPEDTQELMRHVDALVLKRKDHQ